jgi:CheY-like chemotaxis protein
MRGKRILFYDPDVRAVRVAERALAATGSEVVSATDADDLMEKVEANGWDLMMINYDPPLRDDTRWSDRLGTIEQRWPRTKLVLHSTAPTEDYLPLMASRKFLRNVIAKNDEPLEPDELIITAEKLLRQDLFGLQKYLLWGVEPYCVKIRDSRLKQDYINQVSKARPSTPSCRAARRWCSRITRSASCSSPATATTSRSPRSIRSAR